MPEGQNIECGERMTIEQVESLYSQLETALLEHDQINLIADRVQQSDTASLQLIVNLLQMSKQQGHTVKWIKPSPAIINVAELLGLIEPLELTQYITQ
ncbi:MAG: STAS domain-containing protein [Oleispira sp.]|jgi:ABC-type transporter Mla MlaB component|nr:STAS domain-containing protein [Oleispira sp.]